MNVTSHQGSSAVVNGIRSQDMYSYGYNYIKQLPA